MDVRLANCRVLIALTAAVCLAHKAYAQNEFSTKSEALKRHVVAILDDDNTYLGSGASLSAEGLVVTAKHILEVDVANQTAPNYMPTVNLVSHRETGARLAHLVAVHPYLDIALLDSPRGKPIPPLLIGKSSDMSVLDSDSWYVIGHPSGVTLNQKFFKTENGEWAGIQIQNGLFEIPTGLDTGMSGGPFIVQDRILGVVSNAYGSSAFVMPIEPALSFFSLLGFQSDGNGILEKKDHVGELTSKIHRYEEILGEIQVDRRWMCELSYSSREEGSNDSIPHKISMSVFSEKLLSSQPDLNARIVIKSNVTALSANIQANQQRWEIGEHTYYITEDSQTFEFKGFTTNLEQKVNELKDSSLKLQDLKFMFLVSDIWARDDTLIRVPFAERAYCCSFANISDELVVGDDSRELLKHEAEQCVVDE